jgi:hypothetical protein
MMPGEKPEQASGQTRRFLRVLRVPKVLRGGTRGALALAVSVARPTTTPPTSTHGRLEKERAKKMKIADDRRMSEENNGASRVFIEAEDDHPLPTTLTEQSQVFNKQFKPLENESGNRRRFA